MNYGVSESKNGSEIPDPRYHPGVKITTDKPAKLTSSDFLTIYNIDTKRQRDLVYDYNKAKEAEEERKKKQLQDELYPPSILDELSNNRRYISKFKSFDPFKL